VSAVPTAAAVGAYRFAVTDATLSFAQLTLSDAMLEPDAPLDPRHPFHTVAAHPQGPTAPEMWILGSSDYGAQLAAHFGDRVYNTVIPRNVRLAEAPSFGRPALVHDKYSRGALAYLALAGEINRRSGSGPAAPSSLPRADNP